MKFVSSRVSLSVALLLWHCVQSYLLCKKCMRAYKNIYTYHTHFYSHILLHCIKILLLWEAAAADEDDADCVVKQRTRKNTRRSFI